MLRNWFRKIYLAWRQLKKEKIRLAIAVVGIAFADILMFAQMGFEGALFESSIAPHKSFNADLVLVNHYFETLYSSLKSFPRERLYQVLGFAGVESISPLYISWGKWTNLETLRSQTILVFGTDPATKAFKFPEVNKNLYQLQMPNQVLFDRASLPKFGPIASLFAKQSIVEAQLNDVKVRVTGLFTLGVSFAAYGNLISSDSTFEHIFNSHKSDQIEVGLIKLQPGINVEKVRYNLRVSLPNDVLIITPEIFAQLEKSYWAKTTPIGFIFGISVIVSFIVGIVIVYQILYSDVSEHLPEYATLKAIGYSERYLLEVIVYEGFLIAVLGYIPGFIMTIGLYQVAATATMLPIYMTGERTITVFILTLTMCLISGLIVVQKLQSADPADIF